MKVTTTTELGLLLAERRKELGMTQQEFARYVGVPRLWVAQVETGKTNPTFSRLLQVVRRAGLSLSLDARSDSRMGSDNGNKQSEPRRRPNLDGHLAKFSGTR